MISALHALIQDRLVAAELDCETITLVDAACSGDHALESALTMLGSAAAHTSPQQSRQTRTELPGVYLSSLKVSGFRGIGPERCLQLTPGPGLTLLVGRNGCGKSSFAEGLETLLTGDSERWSGRSKDWRDGWKNLHAKEAPFVEATFTMEGAEPVIARRAWAADAPLEASELRLRRGGQRLSGLQDLGWDDAIRSFRPFLTYAELGALLSRPSELYDSLKAILGLDELVVALKRLTAARKAREERSKRVKDERKRLQQELENVSADARAERCRDALRAREWRLAEIEAVLREDPHEGIDDAGQLLRQLAQLELPTLDSVASAVDALRRELSALSELADSSAEQSARLAQLLEAALAHCTSPVADCPVCGATLAPDWATRASARLAEARDLARKVQAATAARELCKQQLRALITPTPSVLKRVDEVGLSRKLFELWEAWAVPPQDLAALCDHAESGIVDLHAELAKFREATQQKLKERESAWRPVAVQLTTWLSQAEAVQLESRCLSALKGAEGWLKAQEEALRDERFAPIASKSQAIWAELRQQSNVDLAKISLEGTGNKRRVELNVSVDGHDGVAVSVMSQGELNALALSLFLPRMMLAESPFRFLVVDDPVQALDSHKVDGLARVLEHVAKSRQVIVLTHDPRLLEATRRLQIDATVLEVTRQRDSVVEVRVALAAVERHLKDAWTIAKNETPIGPELAQRVVPGFCRLAIEAACKEAIRRRRYAKGIAHDLVEQAIEETQTIHPLVSLAVYDDSNRTSDVFGYLNNKLGRSAGDAFRAIKEGAHGAFKGELSELIRSAEKIAANLRHAP